MLSHPKAISLSDKSHMSDVIDISICFSILFDDCTRTKLLSDSSKIISTSLMMYSTICSLMPRYKYALYSFKISKIKSKFASVFFVVVVFTFGDKAYRLRIK